jgi:hypothetical protein
MSTKVVALLLGSEMAGSAGTNGKPGMVPPYEFDKSYTYYDNMDFSEIVNREFPKVEE